ncbi:alanine racemase [Lutibacter sp. B1]|uniref:alanine racemase n=1 Tax=Lutibacter sp. B1 TaxID=2725996 RepID=UPI0014571320|nr:alanine racemase [Lutibacter sp. B1]NLP57761.1 alanine racemase [Lutibacter sp. B1]
MKILHTSYIEISKSALEHNLQFLKNFIGSNVQISSVVKGNAYGHGLEVFVPIAENCGINHFSVFSADEALRVLKSSTKKSTIMIMGYIDNEQLEWAIENNIEFYVFELDRLEKTLQAAKRVGKIAKLHIEVETGMNRTGFTFDQIPAVLQFLKNNSSHLCFKGLCTHFAGAESIANYYRIKKQQQLFKKVVKKVALAGLNPEQKHTACSAAALRYPKFQLDMVRFGIIQYGFFPNKEILIEYLTKNKETENPLKRLISWKSSVMDVNKVKTGEFIGYGTSYLANSNLKIATIPVGYSHGFSRNLSNQGIVLINGQRVNVIGTVNMNMITVDVTQLNTIKKGDEVVLIGKQGDLEISVSSFSEFSEQLNYELLTRLPSNLPRLVVD